MPSHPVRPLIGLMLGCLFGPSAISAEEVEWTRFVPDVYEGELFSGKSFVAGTTEFAAGPKGLTGLYRFRAGAETIEGRLDTCGTPARNTLVCRWTDRFGQGSLAITFTEDLQRFDGFWWTEGDAKVRAPWWGKRRIGG